MIEKIHHDSEEASWLRSHAKNREKDIKYSPIYLYKIEKSTHYPYCCEVEVTGWEESDDCYRIRETAYLCYPEKTLIVEALTEFRELLKSGKDLGKYYDRIDSVHTLSDGID
jgi:hypothetical protein